jgi:alpha-ribazole phosphatase
MKVHIIRHTKVDSPSDTCYGQINFPLADTFLSECEAYRKELPADFDAIFTSPLTRCISLANQVNHWQPVVDDRLMEMNFGAWEGKKWDELDQNMLKHWMKNFVNVAPPDGENLRVVFERAKSFLDDLRMLDYHKILVITHAGIIRCIWAYLLEIDLKNCFKIPVDFGEIMIVNLGKSHDDDFILQKQ